MGGRSLLLYASCLCVSPLLKWSVQIGIRYGMVPFKVELANSYSDAINRVLKLLK